MKKAYAYARYSSDNQREESIDAQLRAIREFAEREGYTIVAEYTDEARSATTDKRPGFQRMIADSALREVSAVLVHKLDRFSRDRYDSAFYKRELKKNGVRLISVLERLDDSPEAIILESVLEGMSEYYSRNLAREVMKGMSETAYQCKHTGGIPPLGYSVNPDKTYSIVPDEADTVRLIFGMYADGKGYSDILAALKDRRTKIGQPFAKNSLSSILRNEKYLGTFVFNRTERKTAGKRNNHKSKPDSEIIRVAGGMPRIISDETWEAVQKRLSENHRNATNKAKAVYILSGKLVCGKCGTAFVAKSSTSGRNKTTYRFYICGTRDRKKTCDMRRVGKEQIEELVIDVIAGMLDVDIEEATLNIEQQFSNMGEPEEVVSARNELAGVRKSISGMIEAFKRGIVHESMYDEMKRLTEREEKLKEVVGQTRTVPSHDEIIEFLSVTKNIKTLLPEEQKQIVNAIIEKIVVYDDSLRFEWRLRIRMAKNAHFDRNGFRGVDERLPGCNATTMRSQAAHGSAFVPGLQARCRIDNSPCFGYT